MEQNSWPNILLVSDWPPITERVGVATAIVLERLFSNYPGFMAYTTLSIIPEDVSLLSRIQILPPFGFFDFIISLRWNAMRDVC